MIFSQARAAIMMYGAAKPWDEYNTMLLHRYEH